MYSPYSLSADMENGNSHTGNYMGNEELAHSERPRSLVDDFFFFDHLINAGNTAVRIPSFWRDVKNVHTSQKGQEQTKR